ncbi:MAG: hypothetical protein GC181_11445 [Bacteroidetes bacterium]|nr:hypothetical protein [Bacteroidota bacterium]
MKNRLLIVIAFSTVSGIAEAKSILSVYRPIAGYGYYEGFFVGVQSNLTKHSLLYFSTGLNTDPKFRSKSIAITLGMEMSIRRKEKILSIRKHPIALRLNTITWSRRDVNYQWYVQTISPQLVMKLSENGSLKKVKVFAGAAYNSVLWYKRKGFTNVGWPKEWQPDFGFVFTF